MIDFLRKYMVSAVVMTVCALIISCSDSVSVPKRVVDVSLKSETAGYARGSEFVYVECSGEWTLSLVFENPEEEWAVLGPSGKTSGTGNFTAFLNYEENRTSSLRKVSVVLTSPDGEASAEFAQLPYGQDVEPEKPATPSVDVKRVDWMELPKMDDPSLEYYSHRFKHTDGKYYRNYSFAYSREDVISVWVAYPLSKFYISGTEGRSDEWAYDPYLGMASPAPFSWYAGDYNRGHLLPSNDRQMVGRGFHSEANMQTYYGTNIAPQIGKNFNQSIWGALEIKINGLASHADTIYVVTGCILAGSSETSPDSDGKRITVPSAFFKACLAYNKATTFGSTWLSAGYLLEHKEYSSSAITPDMTLTIEELERKTGITFFANLASKVGESEAAKIKKQDPDQVGFWK